MQFNRNNEVAGALSDEDTPASRPGIKTVLGLVGVALAIALLVYAQDLKIFFGMS
jgi:hypothetical protein